MSPDWPLARDLSARLEDEQMSYDDGYNKNKTGFFLQVLVTLSTRGHDSTNVVGDRIANVTLVEIHNVDVPAASN